MKVEEIKPLQLRQQKFFQSGITKDLEFRIENLKKLFTIIETNEVKILEALKKDLHKNETEAYTSEISYILKEISLAINRLKKWNQPQKVRTELINKPGKCFIVFEPFGSVLIISPWNYPFGLLFTPIVSAIAAGNCVVAKPSEIAVNSSKLIYEIISENFPDEYLACVQGDAEITQSLINQNTDYIFFTGSAAVGKIIMKSAADYLIPVTLELGGKNPCIVDYEADIAIAVKRIIWGKFYNAGQTCITSDYLLLHRKIKDEFLTKLKETIKQFYGDDISAIKDFSHIINEKHFDRLTGLMNEGKILVGGFKDKSRLYISPTVIVDINYQSKIMSEEIFGPLLPVIIYEDLDEEIVRLQSMAKPLSLHFFSSIKKNQDKIIKKTSSGSVCINGTIHTILSHELPFGGVGLSGIGYYHGRSGFETFSHKKSIVMKKFWGDFNVIYPPYKHPLSVLKKAMKILF